jgi:enoyl-CoA hydratase/carnithine racemase
MSWETVSLDVADDGVATLTVDRPDRMNALDADTVEALLEAVREAERADARVLVLTGAGEEAFVAGADVGHMVDLSTSEALAYAELGHDLTSALATFPAPVVAAVNGYALGGGCELALAADLRIASENAILGQTEVELGIIPGWGGTQRLPRLVGDETARRMILFGERLDASDAREEGLVGEVVARDQLRDHVADVAAELAAGPRDALRAAKEALNIASGEPSPSALAHERRAWSGLFGGHDQREGMEAFVEKRDPDFE